jgi:hypothetical protein
MRRSIGYGRACIDRNGVSQPPLGQIPDANLALFARGQENDCIVDLGMFDLHPERDPYLFQDSSDQSTRTSQL